jgi:hypothetical protein
MHTPTTPQALAYIYNVKRDITVTRLRVAQPTYDTCPITCTRLLELHLTTKYNNQCAAEHISLAKIHLIRKS